MKKFLSLFLAVLMIMSVVPMSVSAYTFTYTDGDFTYSYVNGKKILTAVKSNVKHVVIPEGYEIIDSKVFYSNKNIETVSFPKSLTTIRESAFYNCSNLKTVSFASGSTKTLSIVEKAFNNCDSLYSVYLPENVSADANAFYSCDFRGYCDNELITFKVTEYSADHTHQDKLITLIKATCSRTGFVVKGCTCGYLESYENTGYDYSDHTGNITRTARTEPTCTQYGNTSRAYCRNCEYYFDQGEPIPPLGHFMSTPYISEPTCESQGVYRSVCTRYPCDYEEYELIPSLGGHIDSDHDGNCDRDNCNYDFTRNCGHLCHKDGISGFFYKIALIFWKLFKTNKECSCGMYHY